MTIVKKAVEKAVSSPRVRALRSQKGGLAGYGLAWFLGVPASVLIIIYLLRHH